MRDFLYGYMRNNKFLPVDFYNMKRYSMFNLIRSTVYTS